MARKPAGGFWAAAPPPDPELKPYRSQAEWVRIRQTQALIAVAAGSWLTNVLIALRVFGVL